VRKPTFIEGAVFAFAVSVSGGVLLPVLSLILPGGTVLRLLIAGLGVAYILYLLNRSSERTGRVTTLAAWLVAALAIWIIAPSPVLYALLHLVLVWLIRSLYFYSSALSALVDMGLSGLSLATAFWVASWTGSVFLSLWCFFLVQALFIAIPSSWQLRSGKEYRSHDGGERFGLAYRAAQSAVRKLSTN